MRILHWQKLDESQRAEALARPSAKLAARTVAQAQAIIDAVRAEGDEAVRRCTREFDGVELTELKVSGQEFAAARGTLDATQLAAIERAIANVDTFFRDAAPT